MSGSIFFRAPEKPLGTEDTEALFDEIFEGRLSDAEIALYLSASAERKPTTQEIVGAARSMRAHMLRVTAPANAIDLCGTGGDGLGTLNISTAVSFVVAAAGVPVAKHGNRSMSSKSGAADILEALGVRIALAPEAAERVLADTGLVFLFAQTYHPAMRYVSAARRAIGKRTIFNLLGPLANPAGVRRQLVGIFGHEWLTPYAETLRALGTEQAMVVHGRDGLDEVTPTDITDVAKLKDGIVSAGEIAPEDAGLTRASLAALAGGNAAQNALRLKGLLMGEEGAYRDIVLLNAGAALVVAGAATDIMQGANLSRRLLESGAANAKLEELIAASNRGQSRTPMPHDK